jgi:hypothetical protein
LHEIETAKVRKCQLANRHYEEKQYVGGIEKNFIYEAIKISIILAHQSTLKELKFCINERDEELLSSGHKYYSINM